VTATTTQLDLTLRQGREDWVNAAHRYSISRRELCKYAAVSSNKNAVGSYPEGKKPATRVEAGLLLFMFGIFVFF